MNRDSSLSSSGEIQFRDLLVDKLNRMLDNASKKLGKDVTFAFYVVSDPFVPSFLRVLAGSKLRFPEADSHFRLKSDAKIEDYGFSEDVGVEGDDPLRSGNSVRVQQLIKKVTNAT